MKKSKKIIMIVIGLLLIIYPIFEAQTTDGYVSFRIYGFPIVLLMAIIYILIKKDIIKEKYDKDKTIVTVYRVIHSKSEKVGDLSANDKEYILNMLKGKCKFLNIDRDFQFDEKALWIDNDNKIIKLFCGFNSEGVLDIKVNNCYFSIEGLSLEEKKEIFEITNKY